MKKGTVSSDWDGLPWVLLDFGGQTDVECWKVERARGGKEGEDSGLETEPLGWAGWELKV